MNRLEQKVEMQLPQERALSPQKVITVSALLILLVAVQISTQSVEDWFVFGLNVLEVTAPMNVSVHEVSNVGSSVAGGLEHLREMVWSVVKALVEFIFC